MAAQVVHQPPQQRAEEQQAARVAPLGSLVGVSLENYKWAKDLVANNKTIGSRVGPIIDYTEETTKSVLKKSPIQVEDIVTAVDTRVDKAVTYGSNTVKTVVHAPGKLKNNTLAIVHDRLNRFKIEQDESEDTAEPGVTTIAEDAKLITAERLSRLLDASEGYLAQYFPISEDDRETLKVESPRGHLKPIAMRAGKQGRLAARRMQEQALAKVSGLKKRTGEVVHVDLVKYSEFLDRQKDNVKQTIYITLEKIDEKVVQPTKDVASKSTAAVKDRVIYPAKNRIVSVQIPFKDRFVRIWTVVGDEYNQRVVEPRDQIVAMFRKELAIQQELAKGQSGEDLTITDGLKAVIAAARSRLSKEWEVRVSPTLAKFMRRNGDFDEEELEEKSFGDDEEEVVSE